MSREIKFRCWDKGSKRYGEVVEIEYNESREIGGVWAWYNIHERYEPIPGANAIVEQYTGLKDKNGKEIYEGDIVKFGGSMAVIIWRNKQAEFGVRWTDCCIEDSLSWQVETEKTISEVIGNIHENPELLKKGENK